MATRSTLATPPLLPLLFLALLPASTGCRDRGYTFATSATYDVPTLGFRAEIAASGTVPAGADLSEDGTSRIRLTCIGIPELTIATLQTSNQVASTLSRETITCVIGTNPPVTLPWGSTHTEESVKQILLSAGFTNTPASAFDEACTILYGPGLGPKSTPVGSSTHVRVVSMKRTFQR